MFKISPSGNIKTNTLIIKVKRKWLTYVSRANPFSRSDTAPVSTGFVDGYTVSVAKLILDTIVSSRAGAHVEFRVNMDRFCRVVA